MRPVTERISLLFHSILLSSPGCCHRHPSPPLHLAVAIAIAAARRASNVCLSRPLGSGLVVPCFLFPRSTSLPSLPPSLHCVITRSICRQPAFARSLLSRDAAIPLARERARRGRPRLTLKGRKAAAFSGRPKLSHSFLAALTGGAEGVLEQKGPNHRSHPSVRRPTRPPDRRRPCRAPHRP